MTGSALRPGDLYTPRSQCCPSSLVHVDHSAWAESVVELGLLFAALTHLCETRPLSQTRDRSRLSLHRPLPSLWWKRLWSPPRDATLSRSARSGEKPGGSPDRQGFPAIGGHHYSAMPVCDCVELHRQVPYLEWPHTQHPQRERYDG